MITSKLRNCIGAFFIRLGFKFLSREVLLQLAGKDYQNRDNHIDIARGICYSTKKDDRTIN